MKKIFFLFVALMWAQSASASFRTGTEGVVKVVDVRQKTFLNQYTLTVAVDIKPTPCLRNGCEKLTEWVLDLSPPVVPVELKRLDFKGLSNGDESLRSDVSLSVESSAELWAKNSSGQDVLDIKQGDLLYLTWEHMDDWNYVYDRIQIKKWNGKK